MNKEKILKVIDFVFQTLKDKSQNIESADQVCEYLSQIESSSDRNEILTVIKPKLFSKKYGYFSKIFDNTSIDEKKKISKDISWVKNEIEIAINNKINSLKTTSADSSSPKVNNLNYFQYSSSNAQGSVHILSKEMNNLKQILKKYGFHFNYTSEIEDEYFNFSALNVPEFHPARQMQDTFYMSKDQKKLLRTHTTASDIKYGLKNKPPFKVASMGKVFRSDYDQTHTPMFHQIEMLYVDKKIHAGHLKYIIEQVLSDFFEQENIHIRLRPSFFPFTEPSFEVDIGYKKYSDRIEIGGNANYIEILGSGMIHPNVLKNMNIDSKVFNAVAFGIGVERITMLKYGISDLRSFFELNLKTSDKISHYE